MATVYSALGSEITLAEMLPDLLPGVDKDMTVFLKKRLDKSRVILRLSSQVAGIEETPQALKVMWGNKEEQGSYERYDKVLIAVGRKPNTDNCCLEKARISCDDKGFIQVNANRQTTNARIFAVGDVTGEPLLAHKASHEGRVAAEAVAGKDSRFEPKAIPAVIFTNPEIAWCGLTETQAKAQGRDIRVAKFPWAASGRAVTLNRPDGMTKILIDPSTQRILGMAIVGVNAGELISEAVVAMKKDALASDLSSSIHPHPTLSETLMEAAETVCEQGLHIYRP